MSANPTREMIKRMMHERTAQMKPPVIEESPDSLPSAHGTPEKQDATTYNPKKEMEKVFSIYLASNPPVPYKHKTAELEIRFRGNGGAPLTRIDYDNIVEHLKSIGFQKDTEQHILRIQPEYTDKQKGTTRLSNTRAEIVGIETIQEYCKTNSIQHLLNRTMNRDLVSFTQKVPAREDMTDMTSKTIQTVQFRDFNFRVGYQYEQIYGPNVEMIRNMIDSKKWSDAKKVFRLLNRVRFKHSVYPIYADVSIVRTSVKFKGRDIMVPHYTIQEANVFNEQETYEVELEMDNLRVGPNTVYSSAAKLLEPVRNVIRTVLTAIQGTNYPISNDEMNTMKSDYIRLLYLETPDAPQMAPNYRVSARDFIGPSSLTLQKENIAPITDETTVPNIREGFAVTDKADGERKMLFVGRTGKLYLIDSNMNVQFTGYITENKQLHFSLYDGEHIKYDKHGTYMNMYAMFDIYYIGGKSLREMPFLIRAEEQGTARWDVMNKSMDLLKPKFILINEDPGTGAFNIHIKRFYSPSDHISIFDACKSVLTNHYRYNIDGLIFTHKTYGVGGGPTKKVGPLHSHRWDYSFKWKPAEYNTIDFLVRIQKDETGKDRVNTVFRDGMNMASGASVQQYKTLVLHCGYDEKKHGYINPFQQLLDGEYRKLGDPEDPEHTGYMARPFVPTEPYDDKASLCHVNFDSLDGMMWCEDGDPFGENMVVEFRYDLEREGAWRWIPMRVRYDKTAKMKTRVSANDYTTANSNWYSIHNPITREMITNTKMADQLGSEVAQDVYYNRQSMETNTRSLRDFHNLYVKNKLIVGISNRDDTLIDLSVGRAGDLSKWRAAHLKFVLGIDVSKDNINNPVAGACARYLGEVAKYPNMFGAIFLNGNTGLNIRNGDAFTSHKEKKIAQAIFGEGSKDRQELGPTVYKYYGIAQTGFSICSCQFSLHYFFENLKTVHNFARNVAESTRIGGYFIGTCWDGDTVFRKLQRRAVGEGITIMRDGRKMFQLIKEYDDHDFPDNEASLGYKVNVYQESIGQFIPEYLVKFVFLQRLMENYGFVLLGREDAAKVGLPSGTGMFEHLFYDLQEDLKREPSMAGKYGTAADLTEDEKTISFLNRYFIFKKVRHEKGAVKLFSKIMKPEDEPEEFDVEAVSQQLGIQKKVAEKVVSKEPQFIRRLGDHIVTIGKYNPVQPKEHAVEPKEQNEPKEVQLTEIPEGEPMQLEKKAVIGKKVMVKLPKKPTLVEQVPASAVAEKPTVVIGKKVTVKLPKKA